MASSSDSHFRRGLRFFGSTADKFYLIFIHDLQSWSKSKFMEYFSLNLPNFNNIILAMDKKYSPKFGSYFIIRVDGSNPFTALNLILFMYKNLKFQNDINWILCDNLRSNRYYKKSSFSDAFRNSIPKDFFSNHLNSKSPCFNLCASWNINGWSSDKRDGVLYFISIFKPVCICLQEIGNSSFLCNSESTSPHLLNYKHIHRRANPKVPGMRGLFIGVHNSCSFSPDPLTYNYIVSVNIYSFWSTKCTVGNIYFPQIKWKDARLLAFQELDSWLSSHNNLNHPVVLVGDFNMSFNKIKQYISSHFPEWSVAILKDNNITWSKGTRSSCIDHIIYNKAMSDHVNIITSCNSFQDISDHNPLLFSCKKNHSDGFIKPKKVFKWSRHMCNTKCSDILSHNRFAILAEELSSNNISLSADEMVNSFINTSNSIGKEIKALVPTKLKGPSFHCPFLIKKISHEKHIAYKNIKSLLDCGDIDSYLDQFTKYNKLCRTLKSIKSKFRSNRYKANIISIGNHFLDKNSRLGWRGIKKLSNLHHSSVNPTVIRNKYGTDLFSKNDQLNRWAEHYKDLSSDSTGHSLNRQYWNSIFPHQNPISWDINDPISLSEIRNTVLSMRNNKAPGPDGIPIEFYKSFFSNPDPEAESSHPAKCLEIIFNKIWNGSFPKNWNSAAIVSIPKKGDLSDCNNYRGISLINVGLKIISKIITDRISNYALSHNFIRPEQFGFRNKEECISLFISIREICQRRKFMNKFTYVAFLDLRKAYDSVPIFNILTKLFNLGIRDKCFDFLSNLYLSSKARARFLDMLSYEFPVNRGVRQGCPLSPILFNLFINDVLKDCNKYGVNIGNTQCCGGLFADDIVLIAPSKKKLQKLLRHVLDWANTNEMSFGIKKCATMVIKPINFIQPQNYEDPTFYIGINSLPKVSCYTYLGIPFSDDLSLKPILSNMYTKMNRSLYFFNNFLSNRSIPIGFKQLVLQSFIISKVIYYSPLLGSNKKRTSRVQSLVHKAILWIIGTSHNSNSYSLKSSVKNPFLSLYALTRDLNIPPLSGVCAAQQIKCFSKWKSSNCIIRNLVNSIPPMSHYSWTKETRTLRRKLKKNNLKSTKEVKEYYWKNSSTNKGIKAQKYKKCKYSDTKKLFRLSFIKPHLNLGINWILRIRANFENSSRIAIASDRVTSDCPKVCPCCGLGNQSFLHWILECTNFNQLRWKYLYFINDLYNLFLNKYKDINASSFIPETELKKIINNYIFTFLLGGTLAFNELRIDSGEQRHLNELLYEGSSGSPVPYLVGLAQFLTHSIPIISSSMELLFDRFSKTSIVTESADVALIWQRNNSIPYTGSNTGNSLDSWESLVDTTLSFMMLLLYFIILEFYLGRGDSCLVHSAVNIDLISQSFYIFYFNYIFILFN